MRLKSLNLVIVGLTIATITLLGFYGCKKETAKESNTPVANLNSGSTVNSVSLSRLKEKDDLASQERETVPFNLNVILFGENYSLGYIRFRQYPDSSHIIHLDTWVFNLKPNHSYLLQRAVDALDYNCTSTTWLTLGKGLTAQAIQTNSWGNGMAQLYRNVSSVSPGSTFDIHFQVIDAVSSAVVLKSGCYQYQVR